MSALSPTLLNDGGFFVDLGESSLNSFGVDLPYLTDSLGGDIPANIPNPPLTSLDLYDHELTPFVPVYIPTPTGCLIGCAPNTPGVSAVPEPSLALIGGMLLVFLLLVDARRRRETWAALLWTVVIAVAVSIPQI